MSTTKITNSMKYHSEKHYLAKRIVQVMSLHKHFVEPYFGSGAVLFQKGPSSVSEVANDILSTLMTLWKILQYPELFERFARLCNALPFFQQMWEESKLRLRDEVSVVRVHIFFILNQQSRQGLLDDFVTLSRNRVWWNMNEQVSRWLIAIDGLPQIPERLKRVVIFNRDAIDVIQQQDDVNPLFYFDPPYLSSTHVATSAYQHEMKIRAITVLLKRSWSAQAKTCCRVTLTRFTSNSKSLAGAPSMPRPSFRVPQL